MLAGAGHPVVLVRVFDRGKAEGDHAEPAGVLNELPPSVCDRVLTVFYDRLIRPAGA